jgi:hypothetical protein
MWPHKDLGWWGFVVSVACLILTVPLAILANFLTPKLKVWWTIRSLGSATKKLNGLLKLMKKIDAEPELSHSAATILSAMTALVYFIFAIGYSLLLAIIFATGSDVTAKTPNFHPGYLKLLLAVLPLQVAASTYCLAKIQYASRTSAKQKERLRKEIKRAEVRLREIVEKTENDTSLR